MAAAPKTTTKRTLEDVSNTVSATSITKKPRKETKKTSGGAKSHGDARAQDVLKIKSILNDIQTPGMKSALEALIECGNHLVGAKAAVSSSATTVSTAKDEAQLQKAADALTRKLQGQINEKLKWKNSFRNLKGTYDKKGARVEVVCSDPSVFEKIFEGGIVKKAKDGKLSCSVKTEEEWEKVENLCHKLQGKGYRYNNSYLAAPFSASLKDSALVFSFKYGIA